MKQVWQAEDGKTFETEQECKDYEEELQQDLLRQKWMEQNDVEKLFGKENHNHTIRLKENQPAEYYMKYKKIYRSADNQYFNNDKEYTLYEKELRNRDLSKIIDEERVWRSNKRWEKKVKYFATEEECSVYERTALTGETFETIQEAINKDEEIHIELLKENDKAMREWQAELESDRDNYEFENSGWGEELNRRDPFEGSPN